ncbi:MAG TPA: RNA 2',3'-cyclic phosphodiesterase [Terracidiphilus sp.]|jgi:2'-5' RNA ligase
MRLFIGIPLGATVAIELAAITERLKSPGDGLRWSAVEGWHITLQFLGQTHEARYTCVVSGLRAVRSASFPIQLEPPGFFDSAGVFFAGVRLSPPLERLQQDVVSATASCGFVAEERPYHPHITLARAKGGGNPLRALKPKLQGTPRFSEFVAREFRLYESFSDPGGSRYEVRERFVLG